MYLLSGDVRDILVGSLDLGQRLLVLCPPAVEIVSAGELDLEMGVDVLLESIELRDLQIILVLLGETTKQRVSPSSAI